MTLRRVTRAGWRVLSTAVAALVWVCVVFPVGALLAFFEEEAP